MNDQQATELISKSLSGVLNSTDETELKDYLSGQSDSKSFAQLSSVIQDSAAEMARVENVVQANELRLSEISKERMRRLVRDAAKESRATTPDLLVAETATAYFSHNSASNTEESRHGVSRFTLLRKIGEGGLGTVWLARDEKLRRNVALKEMTAAAAQSPNLWKRFQREAEITGHLEHPNVVPLYMSGVNAETGSPFYVMRFLGKETFADAIREYHARRGAGADNPIHLHRLLTAFLGVCQAIAFAHARGVIHRDLKPENVALDSFGQVVVLDWGLAKLDTDGELATRFALSGGSDDSVYGETLDGDVIGTPLYMSPEQAAGNLDSLDERTDVYGLGAILFSILTGAAPHENSSKSHPGATGVRDFLNSIASSATPKPRDFNSSVPRDLEAICLRAMSTERFARHTSAEELASDVESWIAGKHQRQAKYDALRMTGRDLKSRLCVQIRQLAVTAQFMVELPPIQGLLANLDALPGETGTWKERLSTILMALAKTKSNLTGLSYAQVAGDRINELVRIERSLQDVSNIRGLPASRLRQGTTNTFHKIVMQQFPGECCIDLDLSVVGSQRIVAGVPVFDSQTEEPFGLVLAEAEVGNLARTELAAIDRQGTVFLVDDQGHVLFSSQHGFGREPAIAPDVIPRWDEISKTLSHAAEYIDADLEFYATTLAFPQNMNSLRIVFQVE
jgi:eukaryotic-like serine/threonine-protein kinase